ncbi:MAG: hypothetical protein ACRC2T_05395 [Thermoguttaceae bacterium]
MFNIIRFTIFTLVSLTICQFAFAEDEPDFPYETKETEHFVLKFEVPSKPNCPSIDTYGALLESLWKELDHKIGQYCTRKGKALPDTSREPKCTVIFCRDLSQYFAKPLGEGAYSCGTKTIYIMQHSSPAWMLETLIHEGTHYYCDCYFPYGLEYYPDWFSELVAIHFSRYQWNGNDLVYDSNSRSIYSASHLSKVRRLLLLSLDAVNVDTNVPLDLTLLNSDQFINNGPLFAEAGDDVRNDQYEVYGVLGLFLFDTRHDVFVEILKYMSTHGIFGTISESTVNQLFNDACNNIVKKNPVYLQDLIEWIQNRPATWELITGTWHDTPSGYCGAGDLRFFISSQHNQKISVSSDEPYHSKVIINHVDRNNFVCVDIYSNGEVSKKIVRDGIHEEPEFFMNIDTVYTNENKVGHYNCSIQKKGDSTGFYINEQFIQEIDFNKNTSLIFSFSGEVRINQNDCELLSQRLSDENYKFRVNSSDNEPH